MGAAVTQDGTDMGGAYLLLHVAHLKIPRHILFVDDFPITVTGKVQKFAMREQTVLLLK